VTAGRGSVAPRRDVPARVLEAFVRLLDEDHAEWGVAMTAELAGLGRSGPRRRFAVGCCWAVAVAPAADAHGSRLLRWVLAACCVCAALVGAAFVRFPGLVGGPGTWFAVVLFACVLVGYVGVAFVVAGRLRRGARSDLRLGGVGGLVAAGGYLLVGLASGFDLPPVVGRFAMVALVPLAPLLLGAALGATRRIGTPPAATALPVAALVGGLTVFLLWVGDAVLTSGRPYDNGLLRDFRTSGAHDLATYALDDDLGSAMVLLVLVPLVTVLLGWLGLWLGTRARFAVRG
jgi:hypothetical protein